MLAATGKDQRQASRILPGVTSGACHVAAGIVRLRRRPWRGCSGPGGHLGRVARHVDDEANGAASLKQFRHRFAIVCLRGPQSRGKCGNPRQCGDLGPARDFAADRRHSPVEGSRLKIVVSPVRVRVSPLSEVPANRPVLAHFGGPRERRNSGTRTVTPHDNRMVLAPICISTAQCMPALRNRQVKPVIRGHRPRGLTLVARVPETSSQPRDARAPGAQPAGAGARTHRRLGGAHGQDVWRASAPRRRDEA